jgi:hypothetical protein
MRALILNSSLTQNLTQPSTMTYVNSKTKTQLLFTIKDQSNLEHLKRLKRSASFTKCIETLYLSNSNVMRTKWRRSSLSLYNNRYGKSIYNTDLLNSINVHSASITVPGSSFKTVPIELGFVSHFRDVDHETITTVQAIEMPKFDLEYLFFLAQNAKKSFRA